MNVSASVQYEYVRAWHGMCERFRKCVSVYVCVLCVCTCVLLERHWKQGLGLLERSVPPEPAFARS